MNVPKIWLVLALTVSSCMVTPAVVAQGLSEQRLAIVEEKLDRLRAELEAVQFNQKKQQEQLEELRSQINALRRGENRAELDALQARLAALDAARERDKQIILDTLARELAALSGGKPTSRPTGGAGQEYVVVSGDTLSSIARAHGVTVAELRRANNLTSDQLKVGQKLIIPRR